MERWKNSTHRKDRLTLPSKTGFHSIIHNIVFIVIKIKKHNVTTAVVPLRHVQLSTIIMIWMRLTCSHCPQASAPLTDCVVNDALIKTLVPCCHDALAQLVDVLVNNLLRYRPDFIIHSTKVRAVWRNEISVNNSVRVQANSVMWFLTKLRRTNDNVIVKQLTALNVQRYW